MNPVICLSILLIGGINHNIDRFASDLHFPSPNPFYQPELTDSGSLELLGSTLYANECMDVVAEDGYMYIVENYPGYNGQIKVIDIANPANPFLCGAANLPPSSGPHFSYYGLCIAKQNDCIFITYFGYRAYVSAFDVSDPSLPIFLDSLSIGARYPMYIRCKNDIAFLVANDGYSPFEFTRIFSIDISNPQSLTFIDSVATTGMYKGFSVGDSFLYSLIGDTMKIYSVDMLGFMTFEGEYIFSQSGRFPHSIHTKYDSLAFIMGSRYLSVLDVSDPASPFFVAEDSIPFNVMGRSYIVGSDSSLFINSYDSILHIYDIQDPLSPTYLTFYEMPYSTIFQGLFLLNEVLYTANHRQGCQIIKVSDPSNPELMGWYRTNGYVRGVALDFPYAYVGAGGLAVVNVSNPYGPEVLGIYGRQLLKETYEICRVDDNLFVGANSGLTIFDISNPQVPLFLSHLQLEEIRELCSHDTLIFLGGTAFYIVNVAHPSNPQILYTKDSLYISDFRMYNNLLCYLGREDTLGYLRILDIADPANPTTIGSLQFGSYFPPRSIEILDTLAFISVYSGQGGVVNLSDPANPYIISTFNMPRSSDLKIDGNLLFSTGDGYGFFATLSSYDITDPINPQQTALCHTMGCVEDGKMAILNNLIYLGNFEGFAIYEYSQVGISEGRKRIRIPNISVYPNPFRDKVTIGLSVDHEETENGDIVLRIYDSSGRLVKDLSQSIANSHLPFSTTWDGTDKHGKKLPVGVYFLKLNTGEYTASKKLLMVR